LENFKDKGRKPHENAQQFENKREVNQQFHGHVRAYGVMDGDLLLTVIDLPKCYGLIAQEPDRNNPSFDEEPTHIQQEKQICQLSFKTVSSCLACSCPPWGLFYSV
jgi:hypothetical protein